MKDNSHNLSWFYKAGFFAILTLPLIAFSPFFWPPSWTKLVVFKIIILTLIGYFIYQWFFKHKNFEFKYAKNNPIVISFGLFFIVFFLACIFSVDPYFSFFGSPERGGGFINLVFYGLFLLITAILLKKEDWKTMWTLTIGVGVLISLVSILAFYGFAPSLLDYLNPRAGSTIGNSIPFGMYLIILLFIAVTLLIPEQKIKNKIFYGSSIAIFLFTLFLSGSRGAYLGFLIAVLYFLIAYPLTYQKDNKKIIILKIVATFMLFSVIAIILYANYTPNAIPWLSENKIAKTVLPRLSFSLLAQEGRFSAWGTVLNVIKERPLLGWGPENLAVGFDKNFDPQKSPLGWWDRAHNIFLEVAATGGILGLMTYIGLLIALFWTLRKIKSDFNTNLAAHGIQSSLIGYVVAGFFGIDTFETLLLLFFVSSYTIHISSKNNFEEISPKPIKNKFTQEQKRIIFSAYIIMTLLFLWSYNINPFFKNVDLNVAKIMATHNLCNQAMGKIDAIDFPQRMLGIYGILEAEKVIKLCIENDQRQTIAYSKKGLEIIEKSLATHKQSSRLWTLAGSISSTIAAPEEDPVIKEEYLSKSSQYFQKALELSPKSQEILTKMAQINVLRKDCTGARAIAEQCITLNPNTGGCYWVKAQSLVCIRDLKGAEENIEKAKSLGFESNYVPAIQQLITAYITIEDYRKVAELYELLIEIHYYNIQYRASLAEAYRLSGQYKEAKETALRIIEMVENDTTKEQVRKEVQAFLQILPPQYR